MPNERLRDAMAIAHIDLETISQAIGVDPKTVQRWLSGRVPHTRHRWKIVELLQQREEVLWPSLVGKTGLSDASTLEVIAVYAHRADVPASAWWKLFKQAKEEIDLLAYAMLFLPEQYVGLVNLFREKATQGCKIRIALADPTCDAVRMRDQEEHLGGTLPGRIKSCLSHFRPLLSTSGIEIHYHATVMYNSLFRVDDEMFVTPHLFGLHGSKAPLFHLRRLGSDGVFTNFTQHVDQIWQTTRPIEEGGNDGTN